MARYLWRRHPHATAALILLAGAVFALGSAWFFQLVIGLEPCALCLEQRKGYYVALVLAPLTAWLASTRPQLARLGLLLLGGLMLATFAVAVYHSGAEWGFWPGPSACSGAGAALPGQASDLLGSLAKTRVVSCTEVQWRLFGLSMAGYNALISAALAVIAFIGASRPAR